MFALDILFDKKLFAVMVITMHRFPGTQIFMTHKIQKLYAFIFYRNYVNFPNAPRNGVLHFNYLV
jgi:hypothetical protein